MGSPIRTRMTATAILLAVGVGVLCYSLLAPQSGKPRIRLEPVRLVFANLEDGESRTEQARVYNDGSAALLVSSVQASCGCSQLNLNRETIQPNHFGVLSVTLDGRPTLCSVSPIIVAISSNDPDIPRASLAVKCSQTQRVKLHPISMEFGDVSRASLPTTRLATLHFRDPNRPSLNEITLDSDRASITVEPVESDNQNCIDLSVTLQPDVALGEFYGRVACGIVGTKTVLTLEVRGCVVGRVSPSPRTVLIHGTQNSEVTKPWSADDSVIVKLLDDGSLRREQIAAATVSEEIRGLITAEIIETGSGNIGVRVSAHAESKHCKADMRVIRGRIDIRLSAEEEAIQIPVVYVSSK